MTLHYLIGDSIRCDDMSFQDKLHAINKKIALFEGHAEEEEEEEEVSLRS